MYTFLRGFFAIMGVLFCIVLGVMAYLIIADPFHLRPLYQLLVHPPQATETTTVPSETTTDSVVSGTTVVPDDTSTTPAVSVSAEQAEALKTIGIDAAAMPATFTATQLACFVKVLGQARVDEIKAGAVPSASEFFTARTCLQ